MCESEVVPTWFIIQILGIFLLSFLSFKNTMTTTALMMIPTQAITNITIFIPLKFSESSPLPVVLVTSVTF